MVLSILLLFNLEGYCVYLHIQFLINKPVAKIFKQPLCYISQINVSLSLFKFDLGLDILIEERSF